MSEETEAEELDTKEQTTKESVTKEQTTKESVTTEQTTAARTVIPEGCRYRINATSKMLYAGDYFPEEVGNMDYFWTEDYRFYAVNSNGCIIWKGDVSDKTKTSYGEIPEYICGYPVTYISFYNCTNIPNAVENMSGTFDGCEILETVPDIPDSVTSLSYTFRNCYKLK